MMGADGLIINYKTKQELNRNKYREYHFVIWGVGDYGEMFQLELCSEDCLDFLFCDNNRAALEKYKNTIKPENIKELEDYIFVIAIEKTGSVKNVYNQIISMGISAERIYVYKRDTGETVMRYNIKRGYFNGAIANFPLNDIDSMNLIVNKLHSKEPFFMSRWGKTELDGVMHGELKLEMNQEEVLYRLCNNAGVFPPTIETLKGYTDILTCSAKSIDILIAWFWMINEKWAYKRYSPNAILCSSAIYDNYFFEDKPWTIGLKDKRVLVIHPFAKLIEKQYERRDQLFAIDTILPRFELKTYKAVQSLGGSSEYNSWFEALEKMKYDISNLDFDVALIGCGAYGMPLGAFVKDTLRKQSIHIGGSLQLLFGIKGKRWEHKDYNYQQCLYNEYWVRPTEDLKPSNYKNVENGCYW